MRLIFLISLLLVTLTGYSQRTVTDTINGAETVNFTALYKANTIVATCTQLGGTADGTLTLEGSYNGTTFYPVSFKDAGLGTLAPHSAIVATDTVDKVSIDIADALVSTWAITNSNFFYYRIVGTGTTGDTTKVVLSWWRSKSY